MSVQAGVSERSQRPIEVRGVERGAARISPNAYLLLGGASIVGSAVLRLLHRDDWSLFVGQWAPTFFVLGTYSKLVERAGVP